MDSALGRRVKKGPQWAIAQVLLVLLALNAIAAVSALGLNATGGDGFLKVNPSTGFIVDQYGRERIFHGVNVVYKVFPWHPSNGTFDPQLSLNDADIQNLVSWGFNFVRLGVMWPGVEPSEGQINQTYIAVMQNYVDKLYAAGIYVLIDFHQDLISRFYCGEGIPDWAVMNNSMNSFPQPLPFDVPIMPNGYPELDACLEHEFAEYYFSEAVGDEFDALYDNSSDLQTRFTYYWSNVSAAFASYPGVIGYELINEPWPGNIYKDPQLLIEPGYADKKNLGPLYERLNTAIRQHDNEHIIFFERALTDLTGAVGLEYGPGGPDYRDRQIYSYHVYCGSRNASGDPGNVDVCILEDDFFFYFDIDDWKRLGGGSFMTEFGAVDDAPNAIKMLYDLTSIADSLSQSWAYWAFKSFHDITTSSQKESFYDTNGDLETDKVKALSRTYPRAVAGNIIKYEFSRKNTFTMQYSINTTITEPTEIYLNEALYYPDGHTVTILPAQAANWTAPSTNLIWILPGPQVTNGEIVTIIISPTEDM